MSDKKFEVFTENIQRNCNVPSNCNEIMFTNKGNVPVRIDSYLMNPGDVKVHGGHAGEKNVHSYSVVFDNVPGNPLLIVERKIYQ